MPAQRSGSPMTYMVGGKQCIVVAISGGPYLGEFLAFKLPEEVASDHCRASNQQLRSQGSSSFGLTPHACSDVTLPPEDCNPRIWVEPIMRDSPSLFAIDTQQPLRVFKTPYFRVVVPYVIEKTADRREVSE